MLTSEEEAFIQYWEKNRLKQKKLFRQFLVGIPAGLVVVVPIAINFSSNWYKRAKMEANTDFNPGVLIVALLLIVAFMAVFSKKHQWDMREQHYLELKAKRSREEKE